LNSRAICFDSSLNQSAEDLKEIKSLLITYLSGKVTREADKSFNEKGYSTAVFEQWKNEHFRKSSRQ
jgi:hypothetical protein